MIFIAEPVHFGDTHVQINSALIALVAAAFPNQEIIFFAEEAHCNAVSQKLNANHQKVPQFIQFKNYNPRKKFSWWKKISGEIAQIYQLMKMAKTKQPVLIVWTCLFPTGHLALVLLKKIFCLHQKQIIILHGELVYLENTTSKKSDRLLHKILSKALASADENTTFAVLGQQIFQYLERYNARLAKKTFVQHHPFLYGNLIDKPAHQNSAVRLCLFGAQSQHYFVQIKKLATSLRDYIEQGVLEILVIGGFPTDSMKTIEWVNWVSAGEFVPQEVLENLLASQDVALFFYPSDQYTLRASGALHEALNAGLAVYALNNEYFLEVLSGYEMGCLVDDEQEMLNRILELLAQKDILIARYRQQIIMYLQQNGFLLQSEKFKENLQQIGFADF